MQALSHKLDTKQSQSIRRSFRRLFKRSHKRLVRYGLLSANIVVLLGVVVFVTQNQGGAEIISQNAGLSASNKEKQTAVLDQLSSADIAVHVAHLTSLPEVRSVENHADTFNAQLTAATPTDTTVVSKPQIVSTPSPKSKKDIATYMTKDGDTVATLAQQFGISADSIKWSNGLTGDRLVAGKVLTIPPISGIVYTVKSGDTPDTLASKYSADRNQISEFNDAEINGLKIGDKIVIPNGVQPVARSVSSGSGFAWGGYAPVYSNNGYDYGWCTWWAAKRRQDIGSPIPSNLGNAVTWASLARRAGLGVDSVPTAGSVAYYRTIGGLGHVGFVERVNDDGSIWISDMNYFGVSQIGGSASAGGWGRTSYHLVPVSGLGAFLFIH